MNDVRMSLELIPLLSTYDEPQLDEFQLGCAQEQRMPFTRSAEVNDPIYGHVNSCKKAERQEPILVTSSTSCGLENHRDINILFEKIKSSSVFSGEPSNTANQRLEQFSQLNCLYGAINQIWHRLFSKGTVNDLIAHLPVAQLSQISEEQFRHLPEYNRGGFSGAVVKAWEKAINDKLITAAPDKMTLLSQKCYMKAQDNVCRCVTWSPLDTFTENQHFIINEITESQLREIEANNWKFMPYLVAVASGDGNLLLPVVKLENAMIEAWKRVLRNNASLYRPQVMRSRGPSSYNPSKKEKTRKQTLQCDRKITNFSLQCLLKAAFYIKNNTLLVPYSLQAWDDKLNKPLASLAAVCTKRIQFEGVSLKDNDVRSLETELNEDEYTPIYFYNGVFIGNVWSSNKRINS